MAKFNCRIWDKKLNKYLYLDNADFKITYAGVQTWTPCEEELFEHNLDELEISTGLKDKNGKEIFVGDKLSFTMHFYGGYDRDYQGIVKFEDCCFWVEIDENTRYLLAEVVINDDECEIIGNIHENAKILEGK